MIDIKSVVHFSIPVSDVERSVAFYRDIVGCKPLMTTPNKSMAFMDARRHLPDSGAPRGPDQSEPGRP